MDRRNTDMKNKIKKILLLGMTAMFTAGAAGTAVISCPVWADEAEQNSETAEEPKAEDAAVEESTGVGAELVQRRDHLSLHCIPQCQAHLHSGSGTRLLVVFSITMYSQYSLCTGSSQNYSFYYILTCKYIF